MGTFEIGAYCHRLEEADPVGIDHLTCLEQDTGKFREFHKQHPKIQLAVALDKKGLKEADSWKGVVKTVTILAHQGMQLDQECRSLGGFQVRVAIPGAIELLKNFQLGGLDAIFDLMAYDYAQPLEGERTGFHSFLPAIDQTLAYLHDQGVPLKKVNLGLSTAGVLFKNVQPGMTTGFGQPCSGEQSTVDVIDYLDKNPSAKTYYTSFAGCFQSFIYNSENNDWISYDDFRTIQSKIEWARKRGLRGVFIN